MAILGGITMPRSLIASGLFGLLLLCAGDARARQKTEKLTTAKLDTPTLVGSILQTSVRRYHTDHKAKHDKLAALLGDLRAAASAATYVPAAATVTFDGSKFASVKSDQRAAVVNDLKEWVRYALQTHPDIQIGGTDYTRMTPADIMQVVNSVTVRWPGETGGPDLSALKAQIAVLERRVRNLDVRAADAEDEIRALKAKLKGLPADLGDHLDQLRKRIEKLESGRGRSSQSGGGWQIQYHCLPCCGGWCAVWPVWVYTGPTEDARQSTDRRRDEQVMAPRREQRRELTQRTQTAEGQEYVSLSELSAQKRPAEIDVSGLKPSDAEKFFWRGVRMYWQGEYGLARQQLGAAARLREDARFWYFLSLAQRRLGDAAADVSLRRGAEAQARGLPRADEIGRALERVQGGERSRIREAADRAARRGG